MDRQAGGRATTVSISQRRKWRENMVVDQTVTRSWRTGRCGEDNIVTAHIAPRGALAPARHGSVACVLSICFHIIGGAAQ